MKTTPPITAKQPQADPGSLRRGWTTGACATAATKAALSALVTGRFPDEVSIRLPRGERPTFPLALERLREDEATAGIVKDAGDDPDVTHGVTVIATVRFSQPGSGIQFRAGEGVGTVTRAGLPIAPGEPAINPAPRAMMRRVVEEICREHDIAADVEITLAIPDGAAIAHKTWNPRLGIVGGLSILGTTGIVRPFSCSAWIHSIHRGIDVARAENLPHVLGATGATSETTARALHQLPEIACLDMGDFAGGLLKYLRAHPIPRLTLAGGFAKMTKLAQGALDLHSGRSQVSFAFLSDLMQTDAAANRPHKLIEDLKQRILNANSALEVVDMTRNSGIDLARPVALAAQKTALKSLKGAPVDVDVIITDRKGAILAHVTHGSDR